MEKSKGCGERCFCEHSKDNLKCGTLWAGDMHYCKLCFGKISERERILKLIDEPVSLDKLKRGGKKLTKKMKFDLAWFLLFYRKELERKIKEKN